MKYAIFTETPVLGSADSMSVILNWPVDDCDLGIVDPGGIRYTVFSNFSPNGIFSLDQLNRGSETWTLNSNHEVGKYTPVFRSYTYTGVVNLTITLNNVTTEYQFDMLPDKIWYYLDIYWLKGRPQARLVQWSKELDEK